MRYELKSYNDFFFTVEIVQFGVGQTGLTPTISIKKYNTSEYWNGSAWSGSYTTFNMSEVDSTNLPGLYSYNFSAGPNPIDISDETKFLVKVLESTKPLTEYISVTVNRFDNILDNEYNIVDNIRNFFDNTVGFSAELSSIGSVISTVDSNLVSIEPEVKAEVANSILDANIWEPILDEVTLNPGPSNRDTIARAIASNYISNVYKTPADVSTTEDFFTCSFTSSSKFYSTSLPTLSELESLVNHEVVLIKGWDGYSQPTIASWKSVRMKVLSAGIDGTGKFLELERSDGGSESYVSGNDTIIIKNQASLSSEEISSAVWDKDVSSHNIAGSFGLLTRITAGLVHFNHRIKDPEYDQTGRMTGCRIVVYPTASDAESDTNPLSTIIVSTSYNSGNNMSSYLATEE